MKNLFSRHLTAQNQYVETNGIKFAYRAFGAPSTVPLVFLQHFTGTMDDWDPIITDGLAQNRQVILFNNTGIGSTNGIAPDNVSDMARDTIAFISALGLKKVDLLGYSLGGFIAQLIAADAPELVRKVILIGTGPQGGEGIGDFPQFLGKALQHTGSGRFLFMFFENTETSRTKGLEAISRIGLRKENRDPDSSMQVVEAQTKAIAEWGKTNDPENKILKKITQPVLIINGSNDHMMPTINSYHMFRILPNAILSLYPDSAHGSLFQYPDLFTEHAAYFLDNL